MNKKTLIITSVILSVVFMAAHLFFFARFRINTISLVGNTDAGRVLVNDDDFELTFLLMSGTKTDRANGRISIRKFFENGEGGHGYNYPLNIASSGEKIYLLNRRDYFSGRASEYEVCLLDFNKGRSEVIFAFSDEALQDRVSELLFAESGSEDIEYHISYLDFGVDDDGAALYFTVEESNGFGSLSTDVYKGKLIGGELGGVELFSDISGLSVFAAGVAGNSAYEINAEYNIMINGEVSPDLADTQYYGILDFDGGKLLGKGSDGELYLIDPETKTQSPLASLSERIKDAGLDIADLYGVYEAGGGTAAVFTDGERSRLFCPESGGVKDAVYVEGVFELIVHSLIAAAMAWAAVWLIGLLVYTLKTKGRIYEKFAAAALPVMLGCVALAYGLVSFGISAVEEDVFRKSLQAIAGQQRALGLTDPIGDFDPNGEYQEPLQNYQIMLSNVNYLNFRYDFEISGTRTGVRYFGYVRKNGIFSDISDIGAGRDDLDALALIPSKTAEKIKTAVERRSDEYCRVFEDGFEYVAMISPTYFGGDGSVNGVYIYTVSAAEVRFNTDKLLKRLTVYMLILSGVIAVLFTLSALIPLRGLKKLQKKSADYLAGRYSPAFKLKASANGTANEIDVISEKFDDLLSSVNRDFSEIDNLRKANAAYFSDAILKIFGKKTISSVKLGERTQVEAYCVKALLPEKYADFDNTDRLLKALGKRLKEHGAFALDIGGASLSVYSLEAESINILFFLREYDSGIIAAADKCCIDISFITVGGSCRCRAEREDILREEILTSTLINTKSSCAVTESAINSRGGELSKICVGMVDNEFIYDVSDGVRERFEVSLRDQLKRGIELYFNGDHTAAREMFVMILKRRQSDPVARYYIGLIDSAGQKEGAPL